MTSKATLLGMTLPELKQLCAREGLPSYTAKQMCDWLYAKRVDNIEAMTNLSLKTRSRLGEIARIGRSTPVDCRVSVDGTKKYLFEIDCLAQSERSENPFSFPSQSSVIEDNGAEVTGNPQSATETIQRKRYVEAVFIPDGDRSTLCISCQVGCKMGCRFCVTGQQGFHGNLTAGDILNQIFSIPESDKLTNIVFMGMGEPMDNLDNILRTTEVLTSDWGLGWSPHRVTVSSIGITPALKRFLDSSKCHLAISLHNPFPAERLAIMPMQKAYPISEVVALLKGYDWGGQRRVSFEYIMFEGMNDQTRHADELLRLLHGIRCRVNLIRFHASPDTPYKTSTAENMNAFRNYLISHGLMCTIRTSRGEDIMAACGLLAGHAAKE